jgi:hypothetical protein
VEAEAARREISAKAANVIADLLKNDFRQRGYLPPKPFPFVEMSALNRLKRLVEEKLVEDQEAYPLFMEAILNEMQRNRLHTKRAEDFRARIAREMHAPSSMVSRAKMFLGRIHDAIDKASISLEPPTASATLQKRMQRTELFLAESWHHEEQRGIVAIHVDEETRQTILQVGMAQHGVLYVTIPRVLRPEEIARNSIQEFLKRLQTASSTIDPLAVIDGAYQSINFNYLFGKSRVIRAPSGDTARLSANIAELSTRERLSKENTAILNSSPRSRVEYVRVMREDRAAAHWPAWDTEAAIWENTIAAAGFATTAEASRQAFIEAVSEKQNVIVIVAHCDGESLFMPHPDPDGTVITAEYLREHRDEIARNKPMVCLFSCRAGDLDNMANFASTLLECGAAGVIAFQTSLGGAEGNNMLERLLADRRGTPPIEDIWQAMRDTDFFEMEVFLA